MHRITKEGYTIPLRCSGYPACDVCRDNPPDDIPQGWTQEQYFAVWDLFNMNPDGSNNLESFLARFKKDVFDDYIFVNPYAGMFVGIEVDGYTHT